MATIARITQAVLQSLENSNQFTQQEREAIAAAILAGIVALQAAIAESGTGASPKLPQE